ncbi:MAG: hypothetical protein Q9175_000392 [Cornicularia normoerica]
MAPTPLPIVVPALANLVRAAVAPAPQSFNATPAADWKTDDEFIHLVRLIYVHIDALPNRTSEHIRELTLLYWNQYIAGVSLNGINYHRSLSSGTLFSHESRLNLAIVNLHLTSKILGRNCRKEYTLDTWNTYLASLGLPKANVAGGGFSGGANPAQSMAPVVATFTSIAGGSGAPAPVAGMLGVAVGGPAGIGPSTALVPLYNNNGEGGKDGDRADNEDNERQPPDDAEDDDESKADGKGNSKEKARGWGRRNR